MSQGRIRCRVVENSEAGASQPPGVFLVGSHREKMVGSLNAGGIVCFAPRESRGTRMPLLSSRTILAIGAVVDIAMYSGKEPVSAPDFTDRLQLSPRHLEPLMQALVREGILRGLRGPKGGYRLARRPHAISVYDICKAVKTDEAVKQNNELSGLLGTVVMPTLAQAELCFASALARISVEELVQSANLQMLAGYKPAAMARPS